MPPWKADAHYRSFANERLLSLEEIALLQRWAKAGAPRGNLGNVTISTASFTVVSPDLVLHPKAAYRIKGNYTEHFVLYKIPFVLDSNKSIGRIAFVAGNRKLVHHANYAVQAVEPDTDINQGRDLIESDQFMSNAGEYRPFLKTLVYYGGWVPGASEQAFPSGMGFTMPRRGVIILTVHYGPSPQDTSDLSQLNLYFAHAKVTRPLRGISIGSAGVGSITPPLVLPADSIKKFRAQWEVPGDISLLYIWPHMHLLGKKFRAWATLPTGEKVPLVSVPAWDFRWQESYKVKQLIHLPAGTVITVDGTYDNTARNPNNPFSPPQRIVSQDLMESRSEMLNLVLILLPYEEGDEKKDIN